MSQCVVARNQLQRDENPNSDILHQRRITRRSEYGTIFPMPINQGCSFNAMSEKIASVIAKEASAGVDTVCSGSQHDTDARFGRMQEGFSENPVLSTRMGVASVRLQERTYKKTITFRGW